MNIGQKNYAKTVGHGAFGKVRVYYSEKFKRKVVEKKVGPNFIRTKDKNRARLTTLISEYSHHEDMLRKESIFMMLTSLAQLDCCVEILDFASNPFRIIMEYCEGGDIRKILDKVEVPIVDKVYMISQILYAIKKIHSYEFIHGDLKCANIFLVNRYIPGEYKNIRIKIGDFGLSEIGGNLVYGGTPGFMAPEVPLKGGSFESDIYSIGKVMLEIMTQLPVEMIAKININNIFDLKNKLPKFLNISEFYNVVIPCLSVNPKYRPKAAQLCKDFHGLVGLWVIGERINSVMLANYKLGESVPVDTHPHSLILSNAEMKRKKGGCWFCDICQNKDQCFLNNTLSFHCNECDYDLCELCIAKHNYKYVNEQMLKKAPKGQKVYVSLHDHFLLLTGKEGRNYKGEGWLCDICKVHANASVYSFHCKKCGYDVCLKCFGSYFQIRENECCCIIF